MVRQTLLRAATVVAVLAASALPALADGPNLLQQIITRGTIRIAVLPSLPQYSKVMPDGSPQGYDVDIAKRLAAALKVKPDFVVTDIPGRITSLQTRKVDVTIADFTRNVERSTTIAFTDPYLVTSMRLMVNADFSKGKSIAELGDGDGLRIAISRGGTAEVAVPASLPKATLVRFNTQADELSALLNGQADGMAEDELYNGNQIKDHAGKLRQLDGAFARAEIGIGLPMSEPDFERVLNLFVEQFNASGDNGRLFRTWFGIDLPAIQVRY